MTIVFGSEEAANIIAQNTKKPPPMPDDADLCKFIDDAIAIVSAGWRILDKDWRAEWQSEIPKIRIDEWMKIARLIKERGE